MDLQKSVKTATLLPSASKSSNFIRLKGLSQAAKDRNINKKRVKTPQNILLLDNEEDTNDYIMINENDIADKRKLNVHELSVIIKEVNGGLNLSNKHWEETWKKNLEEITKIKKSTNKSTETHPESRPKIGNFTNALVQEKIFKNAAIMGLVNTNKILIKDILYPNNEDSVEKKNNSENSDEIATSDIMTNTNEVQYVPHSEDPEIFVHPIRNGIDVNKFPDIDFTVPHIGKKIKETPQQYFLRTTNDDSFKFVKKTKKT